ncbi:MAG: hypothetical protein J2P36_15525 [Ktedonobacteraceae bacterium]|nr:hypothetical protein [Ktedonobacteraceae bacterium]
MGEGLTPPCLKIVRGQQQLTEEQEAYARQFARERLAAMLSTAARSKQEVEAHLQQTYRAAGEVPPETIRWFDSPLSFVQAGVPYYARLRTQRRLRCALDCLDDCKLNWGARVHTVVSSGVPERTSLGVRVRPLDLRVQTSVGGATLQASVLTNVRANGWSTGDASVAGSVLISMGADVWNSVATIVGNSVWNSILDSRSCQRSIVGASVAAFYNARVLELYRFFHEMFEENKLIHLAHFNEMVSGYRLDEKEAWVVCKPTFLELDAQGRLHSASGPCIRYRDGWGVYAWHGVRVPEKLILHPGQVTREDWMQERNVEVRRAIQERLGNERFIEMVGGKQIDVGRRGKLIEIDLGPRDPERVAHYVQVQDSSTERYYYLRVPPSIASADEAIAWTFGRALSDYQPEQET